MYQVQMYSANRPPGFLRSVLYLVWQSVPAPSHRDSYLVLRVGVNNAHSTSYQTTTIVAAGVTCDRTAGHITSGHILPNTLYVGLHVEVLLHMRHQVVSGHATVLV